MSTTTPDLHGAVRGSLRLRPSSARSPRSGWVRARAGAVRDNAPRQPCARRHLRGSAGVDARHRYAGLASGRERCCCRGLLVHPRARTVALWRRRTLRMPAWELAQLVLGLACPAPAAAARVRDAHRRGDARRRCQLPIGHPGHRGERPESRPTDRCWCCRLVAPLDRTALLVAAATGYRRGFPPARRSPVVPALACRVLGRGRSSCATRASWSWPHLEPVRGPRLRSERASKDCATLMAGYAGCSSPCCRARRPANAGPAPRRYRIWHAGGHGSSRR